MKKIYQIQSNYPETIRQLFGPKVRDSFCKSESNSSAYLEQIKKDLGRTVYLTRNPKWTGLENDCETVKPIKDLWRQNVNHHAYTQGDMDARVTTESLYQCLGDEMNFDLIDLPSYYSSKRALGVTFIDNNDIPCGFSITYSALNPHFFFMTLAKNMKASPQERELTTFISSEGVGFPGLDQTVVEGYTDDNVCTGSQMVRDLQTDPSLPDEIRYLIEDVLTHDGQVNTKRAEELRTKLKTDNSNHRIFFSREKRIKRDLENCCMFSQAVRQNLANITGFYQNTAQHVANDLKLIEETTRQTLNENKQFPQSGKYHLEKKHAEIVSEFQNVLLNSPVDRHFHNIIQDVYTHHQMAKTTFIDRQKEGLFFSSLTGTLATAGVVMIAAGIISNPIGLALVAGASTLIGAMSLASIAYTTLKEYHFTQQKNHLESTLKSKFPNEESQKNALAFHQNKHQFKLFSAPQQANILENNKTDESKNQFQTSLAK